jgi:hypothetical protein
MKKSNLNTINCCVCRGWYNTNENVGRLACRTHPINSIQNKNRHTFDCCGYSRDKNSPHFSYLYSGGCTRADHDVNFEKDKYIVKWADDPYLEKITPHNIVYIDKETFLKGKIYLTFSNHSTLIDLNDCWAKIKTTLEVSKKVETYYFRGKEDVVQADFKEFAIIRRIEEKRHFCPNRLTSNSRWGGSPS